MEKSSLIDDLRLCNLPIYRVTVTRNLTGRLLEPKSAVRLNVTAPNWSGVASVPESPTPLAFTFFARISSVRCRFPKLCWANQH